MAYMYRKDPLLNLNLVIILFPLYDRQLNFFCRIKRISCCYDIKEYLMSQKVHYAYRRDSVA